MSLDFVHIPVAILQIEELSFAQKIMLGLVTSFNSKGLRLSNSELGNILNISANRVSKSLGDMERKGYIKIHNGQSKWRQIYLVENPDVDKLSQRLYFGENAKVLGRFRQSTLAKTPTIIKEVKKKGAHTPKPTSEGAASNDPKAAKKKPTRKGKIFKPPTQDEVGEYARSIDYWSLNPDAFVDFYAAKGWVVGRSKMKDWRAAVRTWKQRDMADGKKTGRPRQGEAGWEATEADVDRLLQNIGVAS